MKINKLISTSLFLFAFVSFVSAQKASINGRVIDKNTKEELIGVNILIQGTHIGTITDFNGNFSIQNIEPGTYNIQCSYISYEPQVYNNLVLKANDVSTLNFDMEEAMLGIKEVTIAAKTVRKTESAVLAMQKKSVVLTNGISAQQMSKQGDNTAAGALKRVTGLSIEGGKYVYVRGLGDRYSKTALNNASVPGLDPNRNSVQMDIFPSNIIENMVVYKTFSPELPGDFSGGFINIETKDFPEKLLFQYSSSLGYNTQASLNADFLTYTGGKYDWLGFDDGSRSVPEGMILEDIPYYNNNTKPTLDSITQLFNKNMSPEKKKSFLNQSHSISFGNKFNLFGKPLGFITSLSYTNQNTFYEEGEVSYYKLTENNAQNLNKEYSYSDTQGENEVLIGALMSMNYKFSDNHTIGMSVFRNQSGNKSARYMYGEKPSDEIGMYIETRTLQYIQRALTSTQLQGNHTFKNLADLNIKWLSSFTSSSQDEPDLRYFTNSHYPEYENTSQEYELTPSKYKVPTRYFRDMSEINFDNKIDITRPFKYLGADSEFKFGAAFLYKYRMFNEQRISYIQQQDNFNGSISDYFSDDNLGYNADQSAFNVYVQDATDVKNSYQADQNVTAGYGMVNLPINEKIKISTGIRVENTNIWIASMDRKYNPGTLSNIDLLPAINLTYSKSSDIKFRLAYSKTVARPTFRELAPYASEDFQGGITYIGNSELQRTQIDNFDIRWEQYLKPGELISISTFIKYFKNPIELVDNPVAVNPELTWQNVDNAKLYGIELELRKNLDFIHFLRNLSIAGNYTFVKSVVSIDSLELSSIHATDPDHASNRVMFGQSPYVINGLLSYKNDSIGLSANLSYNVTGKKLVVIIKNGTPDIYEQPRHQLDFNITKEFGERIKLKFSIGNILNSAYKKTYTYNDEEYIFNNKYLGQTFSISFNYTIE